MNELFINYSTTVFVHGEQKIDKSICLLIQKSGSNNIITLSDETLEDLIAIAVTPGNKITTITKE